MRSAQWYRELAEERLAIRDCCITIEVRQCYLKLAEQALRDAEAADRWEKGNGEAFKKSLSKALDWAAEEHRADAVVLARISRTS